MKRKGYHVKFTNKGNSRYGIASLAISCCSLAWLCFSIFQFYRLGPGAGNIYGGIGMFALLLQILAFILAIRALREQDVFRGIPKASAAVSVAVLLAWAAVYGLGVYVLAG